MNTSTLNDIETITRLNNIPYYSQRDNKRDPHRTCNISACAMAVEGLKPGLFKDDDDYAACLEGYGDTVNHAAHTNMLWDRGVKSSFHYDLDFDHLSAQLKKRHPVVIGILHRGWYKQPTGGHMITVIGEYKDGFIVHDPYGYPISGEYGNRLDGSNVLFSYESLKYRWLADGPRSGWGRIFHG
ncbi:MAG: C39 family peptidase [Cyanobacteria bacterium J06592_8]